jgi:hypothetical protein
MRSSRDDEGCRYPPYSGDHTYAGADQHADERPDQHPGATADEHSDCDFDRHSDTKSYVDTHSGEHSDPGRHRDTDLLQQSSGLRT